MELSDTRGGTSGKRQSHGWSLFAKIATKSSMAKHAGAMRVGRVIGA